MTTLHEILQRLREEPEWTPEQARDWVVQANVCTYAGLVSMIEPLFAKHNATCARLLAVCDALEETLRLAKIMPSVAYERITDSFKVDELPNDMQADYDTLEQDIAQKLAVAL